MKWISCRSNHILATFEEISSDEIKSVDQNLPYVHVQ